MGLSPMMDHYIKLKENHKDCIIFYRLGDFYEMFFEDAVKASEILGLTLTGRDCGLEERAPMCGVPFHAADMYISKLVSAGEKVAICEQLTEPKKGELVKRDIIRIVTAGTIINNELLDEKNNNFLCSVYMDKTSASMSWADITTGEFFVKSFPIESCITEIVDNLVKINAVEIISNKIAYEIFNDTPFVNRGIIVKFNHYLDSEFSINNAKNTLLKQFKVASLESFSLSDNLSENISSAGALISYLIDTQKHLVSNISTIKIVNDNQYMMLDSNAIRNLELVKTLRDGKRFGTLLWLLDKTKTSMGTRKLQSWILTPLNSKKDIEYRQQAVESLYANTPLRQKVSELLCNVKDIGRLSSKISHGNLSPRDCISLAQSLEIIPALKFTLLGLDSAFIKDIINDLGDFTELANEIKSAISIDAPVAIKEGGFINSGYNAILQLEEREREKTGIKTLKIGYNRVFGYYIELTNSVKSLAPYEYVRRQTLTNAERFVTEELKDLEAKILSSEELAIRLEIKIFTEIKEKLSAVLEKLLTSADAIANLDTILSFATVARENNYVRPEITENDKLNIVDGRHPVVEATSKQKFVPNDCELDENSNRMMIITGPNMAGKSTYMRQVALITLMAHIGSFVPCSKAQIPITDKIFTRVGASDNLILDQSTFMVEMSEMAQILRNATNKSLIILDEIGRGTSTFDGLSIAWSVVEHITNNIKAKTLFATHYHELTGLEGKLEGVKNFKVTVKEIQGSIVFLRKIMRGGANRSFGIEVAELAGVDKKLTDRAKVILKELESKDINFNTTSSLNENEKEKSKIEKIIEDLDINKLSPMDAFNILIDLKEKLN